MRKTHLKFFFVTFALLALAAPAFATDGAPVAVTFTDEKTEAMAEKYDFVRQAIQPPESPDGSDFETPPPTFPDHLQMAEITLPRKGLNVVVMRVESDAFCTDGACPVSFHFLHDGKYRQLLTMDAPKDGIFYVTDDGALSLLGCSEKTYERWTMADGALDRPMPADAPGYFVPTSAFATAEIAKVCPAAPAN